jgi:26S proteasome regulatory subunit N7
MEEVKSLEQRIKDIEAKLHDAEENKGAIEVRDAYLELADVYKEQKDWEQFRNYINKALTKTVGASKKLELNMDLLQSYHLQNNIAKYREYLKICEGLEEEGSDWEKKNKMSLYKAIENIRKRNFEIASGQLISTINTFNSKEIIEFNDLIFYCVLLGILSLPRRVVKEKLVQSSDVNTELKRDLKVEKLLKTFHKCDYQSFFPVLLQVRERICNDKLLKNHERFILRHLRIIFYQQFLESYKTVTLDNMALSFGVSVAFIDKELSELIASGKLKCKIDKLNSIVVSQKPDSRIGQYDKILKQGDHLIERLHKLARIAQN